MRYLFCRRRLSVLRSSKLGVIQVDLHHFGAGEVPGVGDSA